LGLTIPLPTYFTAVVIISYLFSLVILTDSRKLIPVRLEMKKKIESGSAAIEKKKKEQR